MTRLRKLGELMSGQVVFPIGADGDIAALRQRVLNLATRLGFSASEQISIVTAISDLAHHVLEHCGSGELVLSAVKSENGEKVGVQAVAKTSGVGTGEPGEPAAEGESETDFASHGLSAARRIVDEFLVAAAPQGGTLVTLRKWPR